MPHRWHAAAKRTCLIAPGALVCRMVTNANHSNPIARTMVYGFVHRAVKTVFAAH
jgi:hypothetical protein